MKKNIHWSALLLCFIIVFLQGCAGPVGQTAAAAEETEESFYEESEPEEEPLAGISEEIQEETAQNGYYYMQLPENEKTVYDQVYRSLVERNEVSVSTLSTEVLDKVFVCVLNDHPEIFYTSGYIYTAHSRGDETVSLSFLGKYDYDEAECERRVQLIEQAAEGIIGKIPADAADFDKIKYVFDTLVNETEYVAGAADNQNICSVFIGHESTCQGYAKATQYLLEKAGIRTTFVSGDVAEGSHAWNLVMADGAWYYLDTTWGDVDYQSQREGETVATEVMAINYDYFMINSDRLYTTHSPNKIVPLPDCMANENNYYVHEGLYLTGLDTEVLHQIFEKAYEKGETTVQFQCANDAVFIQVSDYLLEQQHIFDFVDSLDSVPYVDNPETSTFCFWL
ncbi:MAG: hypothetical protein HDR00_14065 [Lachnospiraceae bacterium]|nr:hypothetical protein [Lachnospiraceae bacterium]